MHRMKKALLPLLLAVVMVLSSVSASATGSPKPTKLKSISVAQKTYAYSGSAKKPAVTVKDVDGKTVPASGYTVKYTDNKALGSTATVQATGKGKYTGTVKTTFKIITKVDDILFSQPSYAYTGALKKPVKSIVVLDKYKNTIPAKYYKLSYANNRNVGKATITATGDGTVCTGKVSETFLIVKGVQSLTATLNNKTAVTVKASEVKSAKKALGTIKCAGQKGDVSYTSSDTKMVTVSKTGAVTVLKGAKKGTYKISVKAAATANYKASAVKTIKITVS